MVTLSLSTDTIREPAVFIKGPEIILLLIAIITFFVNNDGSPAYVASVLLPSLLNALVFLAVYLLGYNQLRETPVELALYSYNVFGLFISSILLLSRSWSSSLIASGVFCLFLTIIYCAEVYFSYNALANRPPRPSNTAATPAVDQRPAVISVPDPGVHVSMPPPTLSGIDTVDLTVETAHHPAGIHHTNPVYPSTMNYPPFPVPDTTQPHFQGPAP